MFDVSREEIVGGSLPRVLVVLAAPLVAQNFALVAQSVIDLFWIGRLGAQAVAAVGLATAIVGLLLVPILGSSKGGQILTSQRVGSNDIREARRVPFNAAILAVSLAVVLSAGVLLAGDEVVALFDPSNVVASQAVTYLTTFTFALVTMAASDALESGFTGWGDTRAAFYVNVVAIVVNLVLDPFLILGWGPFPRLELVGAALATGIGYAVGGGVALALAYRGRQRFLLTRDAVTLDRSLLWELVDVGGPVAVQQSGRHVARLLIVAIVSLIGGAAGLAAYYIGWQVATVAFVPAQGLGQASTSVVGQNIGARQPGRANRATWIGVAIGAGGLSVFAAVQWLVPAPIAHLFVPDLSGTALALTVAYLQILAYGYWALGAIYTLEAGFNGASHTRISMASTLLQYWIVRLPVAAVGAFVLGLGVLGVFWAVTLSNVAAAIGLGLYYYYTTSNGMLERACEQTSGTPTGD